MKALLTPHTESIDTAVISITGSKSESNRLLLLQALCPDIKIENLSESDDTVVLKEALKSIDSKIDIHHAGTAMRFLTAYFAIKKNHKVTLSGSERMHQRPIRVLVDTLRGLGAEITYIKKEGFPPLDISGTELGSNSISIAANVSSQYISALLLIGPFLPKGLKLRLIGKLTSLPYIEMTLSLLKQLGVSYSFENNSISIDPLKKVDKKTFCVESDWSSASYYYSLIALGDDHSVVLKNFSEQSIQGDSELSSIYRLLNVETVFNASEHTIRLFKKPGVLPQILRLNLIKTPDIAQTIAVSCFGLGIGCELTGLQTLLIKETNRLSALKTELEKFGAVVEISANSLKLYPKENKSFKTDDVIAIDTYQDHRMAMAFAPLGSLFPVVINDPMVVTKSYPKFWEDLSRMGLSVHLE